MPRPSSGKVYESIGAASKATNIPVSLLKQAKANGCPAFKGARVNVTVLNKWLSDNPPKAAEPEDMTLEEAKLELVKQQIIRNKEWTRGEKLDNDIKEGLLIEKSAVVKEIIILVNNLREHFRRIEDALPQALQGLSIPDQRLKIRELFDKMSSTIEKSEFAKRGA